MNKYELRATGSQASANPALVEYIAKRKQVKDQVFLMRNQTLTALKHKFNQLMTIYHDTANGDLPKSTKSKALYFKSLKAHQAFTNVFGSKIEPDFLDFYPLMSEFDKKLMQKANNYGQAHKAMRSKGGYDAARKKAKKDLIWGNRFIQLGMAYDKNGEPSHPNYSYAPFDEMRNYYGDTDILRVVDFPISHYAAEYGQEALNLVQTGGIAVVDQKPLIEVSKEVIQVVFYNDPYLKIYTEIHGGGGYIWENLEGDAYPFIAEDGTGFDLFEESRYFEDTQQDFFGWGIMDGIIPLAELETTITNSKAFEQIWDAAAPTIITTNDPDNMKQELKVWESNLARGVNKPIIESDTGTGTKSRLEQLKRGVNNNDLQYWDEFGTRKATEFSSVDFKGISEFAPTAEQQRLKKVEIDKGGLRVLDVNKDRVLEFAKKEMFFFANTDCNLKDQKIDIIDGTSEQFQTPDGYKPAMQISIRDILDGVKDLDLTIEPRMEGALDDAGYAEREAAQGDLAMAAPGSVLQDKLSVIYFGKSSPKANIKPGDASKLMQEPEPEQVIQ